VSGEISYVSMKEIKTGRFILIDNIPCRIVEIETSAPGKHGAAKMRITAVGVFDGQKRTLLKPSDADAEVPIIGKRKAQVVSIAETRVQMMDSETYETFEINIDEEFRSALRPGAEVELLIYGDNRAISRILSSA
jgi:translation initiation factor 5A